MHFGLLVLSFPNLQGREQTPWSLQPNQETSPICKPRACHDTAAVQEGPNTQKLCGFRLRNHGTESSRVVNHRNKKRAGMLRTAHQILHAIMITLKRQVTRTLAPIPEDELQHKTEAIYHMQGRSMNLGID